MSWAFVGAVSGMAIAQGGPDNARDPIGGTTAAVFQVASAHAATDEMRECVRRYRWKPSKMRGECGVSQREFRERTADAKAPAPAEIDPLQLGATYIKRAQTSDGLFLYEFNFVTGRYSDTVNLVRQAGAGYGLSEYFLYSKDESVRDAVVASIRAYSDMSVPRDIGMLVTSDGVLEQARAGTTALALLTELQYLEATGDQRNREIRNRWLLGLLGLYRPGQGFGERPNRDSESPYYNGEGWLALAYYHYLFPDDAYVSTVLPELDSYLIRKNDDNPNVKFFHWGVMAAAKRYEATQDIKFVEFAARQAAAFLDDLRPGVKPQANTCYSVEGLAAVAAMLEETELDEDLQERVVERISAEMEKNLRFQIQPGQDRVSLGDGRYIFVKDISTFAGAFLNGLYRPRVRIDFTQHCLSALVKYKKHGLG